MAIYFYLYPDANIEKDIEDIKCHFYIGCMFRLLLRAYTEAKEYFFSHNQETMFLEIERQEDKIRSLEDKNIAMEREIENLKEKVKAEYERAEEKFLASLITLQKENEALRKELEEKKKDETELFALREYFFSTISDKIPTEITEEVKIADIPCVIVGGHPTWQKK